MKLEKQKSNAIYEAIQEAGLDPIEFELNDDDETEVRIEHRQSGSHYFIGLEPGRYTSRCVIAGLPPQGYQDSISWQALMGRVGY